MSKPHYNEGHKFEMALAKSFGVTSPISGHGSDLELDGFSVEVKKSLSADFGQGTMVACGAWGWESVAVSQEMRCLFVETGLDVEVTEAWGSDEWQPGLPEVKVPAPYDAASRYYSEKGDDYIYIGSHGLYRVGKADPANTGAPILSGKSILRARIKCNSKSRNLYTPNYSVRIISLEKSPVGIDALR